MEDAVQSYLQLMEQQRESTFELLKRLPEQAIWARPAPREWCIGEILDHTRSLNRWALPLVKISWTFSRPFAQFRRNRPFITTIEDVYRHPSFPMKTGWIWPPRYSPNIPVPLDRLYAGIKTVHDEYVRFYAGKDPALLGHIHLYDPVMGKLNLILVLRIGCYHDELHFEDVRKMAMLALEAGGIESA